MYRTGLLAIASLVLCSACATYSLGKAPTENDLRNDGSAVEQDRIYDNYRVAYNLGNFRRPGAEEEKDGNGLVVLHSAAATSDQARDYLSASDEANEIMGGVIPMLDRWNQKGYTSAAVGTALMLGGITFGVGALGILAAATGNFTGIPGAMLVGGMVGLLGGMFVGGLASAATYYLFRPVIWFLADSEYAAAANAFNEDLRDRLESHGAARGDMEGDDRRGMAAGE